MYSLRWADEVRTGSPNQEAANAVLPGIGVAIQAGVLVYARSLIEFYIKLSPHAKQPTRRAEDFVIEDFGLSISQATFNQLVDYKVSIEVHLLHLTAWRDLAYRTTHRATPEERRRGRFDWNTEYQNIADSIIDAAGEVAALGGSWNQPFQLLYDSARTCLADMGPPTWPHELTEAVDIDRYLSTLGL